MGRPAGIPCSPEAKAKISASIRAALARGRGRRKTWQVTDEYRELFDQLRKKFSEPVARRYLKDHAAMMERRKANMAASPPVRKAKK